MRQISSEVITKWDWRVMELAQLVASWSKDPSTKTGAVIVDGKHVVGLGFNGFPRSVQDLPERYDNRDVKYKMVVHCEANAILNATRSVRSCKLYTTKMPCTECTKLIIQAGISRVIVAWQDPNDESVKRWADDAKLSETMLNEAGVTLEMMPRPKSILEVQAKAPVDVAMQRRVADCSGNECKIRERCIFPTACRSVFDLRSKKRCNGYYDDGIADGNLTRCSTRTGCGGQGCPYHV